MSVRRRLGTTEVVSSGKIVRMDVYVPGIHWVWPRAIGSVWVVALHLCPVSISGQACLTLSARVLSGVRDTMPVFCLGRVPLPSLSGKCSTAK